MQLRTTDISTARTAVTSQSTLRAREEGGASSSSSALGPAGAPPAASQRSGLSPSGHRYCMNSAALKLERGEK